MSLYIRCDKAYRVIICNYPRVAHVLEKFGGVGAVGIAGEIQVRCNDCAMTLLSITLQEQKTTNIFNDIQCMTGRCSLTKSMKKAVLLCL
jgi:hypothetical protein